MNKNTLYFTLKAIALAAVITEFIAANTLDGLRAAGALAFCCLFVTDLLIIRSCRIKYTRFICSSVGIAACLLLGAEMYFPILIMQIFELVDPG